MNRPVVGGYVKSIQARLTNEAHSKKRPFAEVLELFAIERFLHRLGRSEHRDRFALKGAAPASALAGDRHPADP